VKGEKTVHLNDEAIYQCYFSMLLGTECARHGPSAMDVKQK